jgi:hypothetical protein
VYDLNQPAAHQFAFGLALVVESELGKAIEDAAGEQVRAKKKTQDPELDVEVDLRILRWIDALRGDQRNDLKRRAHRWERKAGAGEQLRLTHELVFSDKLHLVQELGLCDELALRCRAPYGQSGPTLFGYLKDDVKALRNTVAHDKGELADEWAIWQWMRTTLHIAEDLADDRT